MRRHDLLDDLAQATGFLSRLPVPAMFFETHDGRLNRSVRMFPVAGLVIALPSAAALVMLDLLGASPALSAILALALMAAVTGALHEDGLADCADAFGATADRTRMLAIMKDSRIGTYGTYALLTTFALRAVALTTVIAVLPAWQSAFALMTAAASSRAIMLWHWRSLPLARENGVAAATGAPDENAMVFALIAACAIALLAGLVGFGFEPALFGLVAMALATIAWTRLVERRLGGHTGDTIGATQQISETVFLVALALLL